jgi:four helix bundle protein
MFRFERLTVWQKAVELFELVDTLTDGFPRRVRYTIASQLYRAALSISSNIAEGSGRETLAEMRHFYSIAKGSAFELVSLSIICRKRKLVTDEQSREVYHRTEEVAKMLTALKRKPVAGGATVLPRH